jgi:DNA polymerase III delta prime subunit
MNSDHSKMLLSEVLRPVAVNELALPEAVKATMTKWIAKRSIPNLLFYGQPGTGKTSAARIIANELGCELHSINGSHNSGDKTMVKNIQNICSSFSLFQMPKVIHIDEADGLSNTVQNALRCIVEESSANVRFIMTANDVSRLSSAMRSRFTSILFDPTKQHRAEILTNLVNTYEAKFASLGLDYDPVRVNEIVRMFFPDLRTVANRFQLEFGW